MGTMVDRVHKELTADDIAEITASYHNWRSGSRSLSEVEVPGFCKSAKLKDIEKNDYVLTPGRYVGAKPVEDSGIPFEEKMTELSQTLYKQMKESKKLDEVIRKNLEMLGYGDD